MSTYLPKDHPLRCASCGDHATTTVVLEGFRTPACLRHFNVWRTPDFADRTSRGGALTEDEQWLQDVLDKGGLGGTDEENRRLARILAARTAPDGDA